MKKKQCFYVPGSCSLVDIMKDGESYYSNESFADLKKEHPTGLWCNLDWAIKKIREAEDMTFITAPKEISSKNYYMMLEVLPPVNFVQTGCVESFILCEGVTSDIYQMYFKKSENTVEKFYTCTNRIKDYKNSIQVILNMEN